MLPSESSSKTRTAITKTHMSLSLSFTLFSIFFSSCSVESATVDVSIQQYTGLKRSEIHGIENQYYSFEFCVCPQYFTESQLPQNINKCICSETMRGSQLKQSVPIAKFNSIFKTLRSQINGKELYQSSRFFVKAIIGSSTFTSPEYQAIPLKANKNEVLLKTVRSSKMRLIYTSQFDSSGESNDDSLTNKEESHWRNSILNDVKGGASDFFRGVINQKNLEMKKNEMVHINGDVRNLKTMNAIKSYLFARSRVDKMEPTSYDIPKLKEWILTYHNSYRAMHNSPPVASNPFLAAKGKSWADELAYHKGCLVHEQPRVFGENLFFFGARHLPEPKTLANAIIQSFYLEGIGYNYNSWRPLSFFKTGHFTQLLWKTCRQIGVGVSIVKSNQIRSPCISSSGNVYFIFVVIKYDPAGNFETRNAYLENVQKPIG